MRIYLAPWNRSLIPAAILLACMLVAVALPAQQSASPQKTGASQTVITMGTDYNIVPASATDDGVHYRLNRLAKDGAVYEGVNLRKIGERADGATTYAGPSGTYVRFRNGTLEEPANLSATPIATTPVPDAPLTLMRAVPVASVARGNSPTRLDSLVLPDGMHATRLEAVEGKPVLLLITGIENGRPREIAVQRAGVRLGETFYVRISNPNKPNEPLVYGVIDERTISAYAELPQGVPQLASRISPAQPPRQDEPPRTSSRQPPSLYAKDAIPVHYQGRNATISTRVGEKGAPQTLLTMDGAQDALAIESLHGSASVYTVASNPDIQLHVNGQGVLSVTDSKGAAAILPASDIKNVASSTSIPGKPAPREPVATQPNQAPRMSEPATSTNDFASNNTPPPARAAETNTYERSRYEPPKEIERASDRSRQFLLRIRVQEGITSEITVKPIRNQETLENPNTFYLLESRASGRMVTYTVLPAEQGGILMVVTSYSPEMATATPASTQPQTAMAPRTGHKSSTYYEPKNPKDALQIEMIYNTGQQFVWKLEVEPGRRIVVFPVETPNKLQSIAGGLRIPTVSFTTKVFENFGAPDLPTYFLVERKGKNGMIITGSDEKPSAKGK